MKILHISHRHFVAGGSDAVFFAITRLLQDRGHQVVPFCVADPRNRPTPYQRYFPQAADTARKPVADTLRYFWNGAARQALIRLIAEQGPFDVAHLHIYHGKQTPAILPVLRDAGIPVVQSLHEYKLACPVYTMERGGAPCRDCLTRGAISAVRHRCKDGGLARSAVMWAEYRLARMLGDVALIDRFLCVSDFQRRVMVRAGLPPDKLHVLPNFAETAATPGPGGGGLVYAGRIEQIKGLDVLIDAVTASGARLTIAGSGAWQDELRRRIEGHPHIAFAGFLEPPALAGLVRRADAVVVPSTWYENCPMAVLEAKGQGVPVIAARIGGIPELVRDGVDGFLFAPGDRDDLVRALGRFAESDRKYLARASLADARARFSAASYYEKLLAHYAAIGAPALSAAS